MKSSPDIIITTPEGIRAAFTEWDRRYRENPESFMNEAFRLLFEDEEDYGNSVTPYFIDLLNQFATPVKL